MTNDEKAKAYDEALERAKKIHDEILNNELFGFPDQIREIFPELRESEDERVIRTLYYLVRDHDWVNGATKGEALTWLEKQKEPHIPWYDYQKSKEAGYTIVPNEEYEQLIKQKEQNPAWSEEDEKMLVRIIERGQSQIQMFETGLLPEHIAWLKSLRPVKQEWSKKDEDKLYQVMEAILADKTVALRETPHCKALHEAYDEMLAWLKSLRPSWKPSEEQMNCLCAAVDAAMRKHNESVSGYKPARVLKSLYEQLQRLM